MGLLFLSHSGRDNDAAIGVRDWLRAHGWGEVFLDLDPERGLAPGHSWQQELKQAGERCSGVLLLLSPNWIASRWCQTEFLVADQLGKKIFPVFVAPTPFDDLPLELKAKFQIVDLSEPDKQAEGFERLAIGLKRAGLDPTNFEWPPHGDPHRRIYRGLQSLEEKDAAIFFGRDALITKGLDCLRRMRDGAPERMLVILGASGSGKSSFLKAGLIARLERDEENFLVLPVVRPERAAVSGQHGLAAALSLDPSGLNTPGDILKKFATLRARAADRLRRYAERPSETGAASAPSIVIPIDQSEELFAAENTEAARALELLATVVLADTNAFIVATIRSDAFARMQETPALADAPMLPFSLAAMPAGAFKDAIEGPARLANPPLSVDPALTEQLLKDLATDDALPLLAFTLERLLLRSSGKRALTLADYSQEMGGLQGAILAALEEAFLKAQRDPALPPDRVRLEALAKLAFIPGLVQVDEVDAEPKRRTERLDVLPEATRALIRYLIDARLLVSDRGIVNGVESDTVEVAHEAILRQWPALRSWIAEEREALLTLDGVRSAAKQWKKHAVAGDTGEHAWLTHSRGRLDEAERLLAPAHFANALGSSERDYLAACRARDNAGRERERKEIEREKQHITDTRRLQRNIFVLIGAAVAILIVTGLGIAELLKGTAIRSSDALAKLSEQAADNQDYEQAGRYALAGLAGADWPLVGYSGARAVRALLTADLLSVRIAILGGHNGTILSAALSPDGRRIVAAYRDKTARIWDVATGTELGVLRGHSGPLTTAAYSPDGRRILTASIDKTARIWDSQTGKQLAVLRGHHGPVRCAAYSADGSHVVTASDDKTALIWDAAMGTQLAVLRGHDGRVLSAAYSPEGSRIVTASADKTARVWDVVKGTQLAVLRGHDGPVSTAAYSPDGRRIVTASDDKTARIWDAATGTQLGVLRGHDGDLQSAAFSPDGTRIVTASDDKTARIWDSATGTQLGILREQDNFGDAAFSPDGRRILTASDDMRIWDAATGTSLGVLRGHEGFVFTAAYSPDGRRIVTASEDKTARIWDAATGTELGVLRGHDNAVGSVVYSPDGRRILTGSNDKTARIWDAATGTELAVLRGHGDAVESAAYSPDGTRIVTASDDKTARIWDVTTGTELRVLRGHDDAVGSVVYSPDGRRILTASVDKTARIWDARTGAPIEVLRGHDGPVYSAAYNSDGTRIVTASWDKTARIWDAATGTELTVLRGHDAAAITAAYSPDGTRIVTASADNTARIWDAATGTELAVLRGHDSAVSTATFSRDGRRILTASDDKTARIWRAPQVDASWLSLSHEALIARTCRTLLSGDLDHFSNAELAAAPDLDPKLDADACHPPTLWARLRTLLSGSSSGR